MFVFLCILLVGDVDTCQAYTMMGDVSSYEKDGYNITFNCENGRVRLSFLTETIVRVHMAPAGKEFPKDDLHLDENGPYAVVRYDWPGAEYKISEGFDFDLEGFVYTIRAGKLVVEEMVCSATELQSKARTGGFPVPFFISTRGYGIFFNNLDDDVTFKMGTIADS